MGLLSQVELTSTSTPGTFCKWRAKYGGMQASGIKKMKSVEEENATLNRILGQKELEITTMQVVLDDPGSTTTET